MHRVEDYIGSKDAQFRTFGEFVQSTRDWIVAKQNEKPKECAVGKLNAKQILALQADFAENKKLQGDF